MSEIRSSLPLIFTAYHAGPPSFGIGLENPGVLLSAFKTGPANKADPLRAATAALATQLTTALQPIQSLCDSLETEYSVKVLFPLTA